MFTQTLGTMQDRASSPAAEPAITAPPSGDPPQPVRRSLDDHWPVSTWRDVRVAVAVSGGPDSVALLRCLAQARQDAGGRGDLVVLHLDHSVRGEASRLDARWVQQLAGQLGLASHLETSKTTGPRSEESLRDERRAFYRRAADALGARYLATGHTADDQAETVLFRLLRGAGLRGAAGIRPLTPLTPACSLVRPLLSANRGDVLAYLASIDQSHRRDITNGDDAYARNWLRNQVLPLLAKRFPAAAAELAGFADRAAEANDLVETLAADLLRRSRLESAGTEGAVTLQSAMLAQSPQALVVEALRLAWRQAGWPQQAMTAGHWRQLGEIARAAEPQAAVVFPGAVRVERIGDTLVLAGPKVIGSC